MAQVSSRPTDEDLAGAAKAGDDSAYAELISRYRALAYAYAFARLRSREDAEDLAQETFVRAFESLGKFDTSASWGAYLMRIVRNLCYDALRRRRVRRRQPEQPAAPPSAVILVLRTERTREVGEAVADLPDKYRVPLIMHYGSGTTYREIATALGVPESTVVGRLAGALRLLRRRLVSEVGK